MSQHKRAVLIANFGNIRRVPADILARLRDDILGTGVYAQVATQTRYEDGVAQITAELTSELDGDIVEIVQTKLNEIYGEAEITFDDEDEEDDDFEDDEDEDDDEDDDFEDNDEEDEDEDEEVKDAENNHGQPEPDTDTPSEASSETSATETPASSVEETPSESSPETK